MSADDMDPFLKAIREHPHDDGPRLVLADYLEEKGDQRGAAVRTLCSFPPALWLQKYDLIRAMFFPEDRIHTVWCDRAQTYLRVIIDGNCVQLLRH